MIGKCLYALLLVGLYGINPESIPGKLPLRLLVLTLKNLNNPDKQVILLNRVIFVVVSISGQKALARKKVYSFVSVKKT